MMYLDVTGRAVAIDFTNSSRLVADCDGRFVEVLPEEYFIKTGRPYMISDHVLISLRPALHDWCVERGIKVKLTKSEYNSPSPLVVESPLDRPWRLIFSEAKDAVLFKLTWGNV